jgi:hypothetical protein
LPLRPRRWSLPHRAGFLSREEFKRLAAHIKDSHDRTRPPTTEELVAQMRSMDKRLAQVCAAAGHTRFFWGGGSFAPLFFFAFWLRPSATGAACSVLRNGSSDHVRQLTASTPHAAAQMDERMVRIETLLERAVGGGIQEGRSSNAPLPPVVSVRHGGLGPPIAAADSYVRADHGSRHEHDEAERHEEAARAGHHFGAGGEAASGNDEQGP